MLIPAIEYQRKQAHKKLQADNDASMTAELSRVIKIKKNARVMIRRNIDTSLGWVGEWNVVCCGFGYQISNGRNRKDKR